MELAYPENTWYFLLLLPAFVFVFLIQKSSFQVLNAFFQRKDFKRYFPIARLVLRFSAIGLLILALTGPIWGSSVKKIDVLSKEIYLVMDVSASMNAADIKPNRLEKVKSELKKLIKELPGDKIGLILFTSAAYVQCPLTSDHRALNLFLDLVQTNQFSRTGTNLRNALLKAYERFTENEENTKKRSKSSKTIILITDGEDFGENFGSVTERLKKAGINLFVVGVGTPEGAPIPEKDDAGNITGYKKDDSGENAKTKLNEEALNKLGATFDTEPYTIQNVVDDLKPVIEAVKASASSVSDSKKELVENNFYQFFGFLAVICILISFVLMPEKR